MDTLSLKLPKELSARLKVVAKRRQAAVVREALEEYLDREKEPTPGSVADVARKYIGCLDGGPPDLSTNK
jgi:predicted transcriptional regulator